MRRHEKQVKGKQAQSGVRLEQGWEQEKETQKDSYINKWV